MFNRKKFFTALGTIFGGYLLTKVVPFKFFMKETRKSKNPNIIVRINPNAVSREKSGGMNV